VSDQKTCPACRVRSVEYPTAGGIVEDRSCTGRAGCVRADHIPDAGKMVEPHPERETPAPESGPAGPGVPVGIADIVERLRRFAERDSARRDVPINPKQHICGLAADEIVCLRAEVERLTRKVDHWIGYARTTETHAARLEDRRADLAARVAELEAEVERLTRERDMAREAGGEARISESKAEHARVSVSLRVTKMEADRAALAQRVAEAVRCGALLVVDVYDRARIRAMDLGPIVATALKESAP